MAPWSDPVVAEVLVLELMFDFICVNYNRWLRHIVCRRLPRELGFIIQFVDIFRRLHDGLVYEEFLAFLLCA